MNIRGFKFQVEATVQFVEIKVQFQCKLQVIIKRGKTLNQSIQGSQKLETQPIYQLEKGIAQINETLQFNMSVNLGQDGRFEEKKTQFVAILVTEKGNKNAGIHNLDMSKYLNMQKFDFQEELQLDKCPDKNAKMSVCFKITQIGQLENETTSADQSLDISQVSVVTPGRGSFSSKLQKKEELPLLSERKVLNESKSQLFSNEKDNFEQKLTQSENHIKELSLQILQLKSKVNEMIDKEYFQQIVSKYEQQLTDLQSSYKQVCNENYTVNIQFKAKVQIINSQSDEIIQLQGKLKQFELEKQDNAAITVIDQNLLKYQSEKQLQELQLKYEQLDADVKSKNELIDQLKESLANTSKQLLEKQVELQMKQNQFNEKLEQMQNLKNLTSGTISALSQRNEVLEKRLAEQKEIVEKLKEPTPIPNNDSSLLVIEELQSALSVTKNDLEVLQQKYECDLAKKDEITQNLQQCLDDAQKKELDTSKTSQESKIQAQQLEQQVEVSNTRQDKSLAEQQLARLRNQVQVWQSKWENNQKVLSDYTNEVQQMSRQVADIPSFIEDQRELPEQLQLLKRAIQRKLQNYQVAQQHFEQEVQRLEQELEVCQYKLKLEQSQQCSDSQFQEKMQNYSEEINHLNSALEQKNQESQLLQQQVDQLKQSEGDLQKSNEEQKTQLLNLRQTFAKVKQQLAEALQEKVLLQARVKEQTSALKEKNQEIQKGSELIQELEQYNIQMEEALSGTLDQYKTQNQQMKSAYEKEKNQRLELQKQIKTLKEESIAQSKGVEFQTKKVEEITQCNCKEKIQSYEQQIAELQIQVSEMQIQIYDKAIMRNSIAQIRTSVLVSRRESLALAGYQNDENNNKIKDENNNKIKDENITKNCNGGNNEECKVKELEEKVVNLQDERIKISKEYQTVLERALLSSSQLEHKYKQQLQELNEIIERLQQELVLLKLKIGDMFNAAIEVGGATLVDKMQIALGLKE